MTDARRASRALALAEETAGFPRVPPSPRAFAPQLRLGAAPARSVAAAETLYTNGESCR
jgi:hypothetical protein